MVPDYYARLGVDPKADRAEIEAALAAQAAGVVDGHAEPQDPAREPALSRRDPRAATALLSDPATRAAYDAELAVAQRAERERKLDELQRRVRLRAAKGGLGPSDRGLLVDEATRLGLNEDDLVRLTRPIPSLVEATERQRRRRDRSSTRRPTSSTRPPVGRSAWRWSTWAAATSTMPWA